MNEFAAAFLKSFPLADRRPVTVWAADGNVRLPHSKRCSDFREDTAYWINEPLNATQTCEAVSVCKPTQGSGTTLEEVFLAHTIATHPRDTHFMAQTDPDAEDIFRKKLLRTLRASPATAPILATAGRHDITKNRLEIPTMNLAVHGPGENSMQSDSVEVLLLDEAWRYPLGTILEILERTSTVEATRKIVTVSQAGEEITDKQGRAMLDEWGQWWHRGTQEEFRVQCPACSSRYYPETSHFHCDEGSRDPETKAWNWQKVRASAHHIAPCCGHRINNTPENRRSLSSTGVYVVTNFNAAARHRSFRYSAWIVYWQDWGGLLEQFLRAQDALRSGDIAPLKIWTQKKEARWWKLKDAEIPVVNSKKACGYALAEYEPKEGEPAAKWGPELVETSPPARRMLGFDVQRDRMPLVSRAFAPGRSRQIFVGEVQGWNELEDLAESLEVPPHLVVGDCGNWRAEVQKQCWLRGWTPFRGRDIRNFSRVRGRRKVITPYQKVRERLTGEKIFFHPRPQSADSVDITVDGRKFSVPRRRFDIAGCAFVDVFEWSNVHFKDILARLKAMPEWEFADDVPSWYLESMESEAKNAKTGIWEEVRKGKNHWWDCEAELTFAAALYKLVGGAEEKTEGDAREGHEHDVAETLRALEESRN